MKTFNIHLKSRDGLTLTIVLADQQYKIIYDGGIIGALTFKDNTHQFVQADEVVPGQLPLFEYKKTNDSKGSEPLSLRQRDIDEIADQIRQV